MESFVGRIDVTAVELMIDVRDARGNRVLGLTAADFEVLEDGTPMTVLGVDYPLDPAAAEPDVAPDEPEPAAARAERWRSLIYVDLPLTRKRTLRRAVETLVGQADDLVALGPVEVVMANPAPRVMLHFSRDAARLRAVLGGLDERAAGHELVGIRRDFLRHLDMRFHLEEPGPGEAEAVVNLIRGSVDREYNFLRRRLETLAQWIAANGHVPASAAILVSDGYDLAPGDFYIQYSSTPEIELRLSQELTRYRVEPLTASLAREMAAHGWTGIVMALGGSPLDASDATMAYRDRFRSIGEFSDLSAGPGSASPLSTLQRPAEPLYLVAGETGGEVLTARRTAGEALGRLGDRLRLTYQATRPSDGRIHQVEVRLRSPGLKLLAPRQVRSPTPEQIAGGRARRLLISDTDVGDMPVRLEVAELGAGQAKGSRRVEVDVVFDLNLLRPVLPEPVVPFSFTFGFELAGASPLIRQVTQQVSLPPPDAAAPWPRFSYKVAFALSDDARRIAVVVEEPASGIWGGAVAGPGR